MIRYIRKDDSPLMRALAIVLWPVSRRFMAYWTALRLPFGAPTIYYPPSVADPRAPHHALVLAHEMVHVRQQLSWYGLLWSYLAYTILPLPFLLSGRWLLERDAWLLNVKSGADIDHVVERLWGDYGWPWPREWMRRWFEEQC